MKAQSIRQIIKGGSGSGYFGHSGRPGRRGGSSSGRGSARATGKRPERRKRPRGRTVKIPGGFDFELRRGERVADVGKPGHISRLPQGMVAELSEQAPWGRYRSTGQPRKGPSKPTHDPGMAADKVIAALESGELSELTGWHARQANALISGLKAFKRDLKHHG